MYFNTETQKCHQIRVKCFWFGEEKNVWCKIFMIWCKILNVWCKVFVFGVKF